MSLSTHQNCKSIRASPTPRHTSLEERSARFIAKPLFALP